MLSTTQQRLLVRLSRRRLLPTTSRNALVYWQSPLVAPSSTSSAFLFHRGRKNTDNDENATVSSTPYWNLGLPSVVVSGSSSSSMSRSLWTARLLEQSYPMGLIMKRPLSEAALSATSSKVVRFSTEPVPNSSNSKTDRTKKTYRERAVRYREKATDGAKSFGGLMQKYGPVFVGTYLSVYVMTLGGLYAGVESGIFDPVTMLGYITGNHEEVRSSAEVVAEMLGHYSITEPYADVVKEKPHLAKLAVAWIATKFTEPIRLGTTAVIVPRVARYFGVGTDKVDEEEDEETIMSDGADTKVDEAAKTNTHSDGPIRSNEEKEEKKL